MNKNKYFEISVEKKLPLRCPILNYCTRRAYTIYFFSDYKSYDSNFVRVLQEDGILPSDFIEKQILLQGEFPSWSKSNDTFYFTNTCPEVNLFDSDNSLIPDNACVEGDYDKHRIREKKRIIKCQHFCECPEFNNVLFEKKLKINKTNSKKRLSIPHKVKSLLQKEINSKCPFCSNEDVDHFQIHHINENTENNNFENLLMLCPICHSKITKKDISYNQVIELKTNLSIK